MMLALRDLVLIGLTALGCTAAVTLLAWAVLRIGRPVSLGRQQVVLVGASLGSVVLSTLVIAAEMYLSRHDLTVLVWVVAVSTVFGLVAARLTAGAAHRAMGRLGESVRQVGEGGVVRPRGAGWRELDELEEQLADASEKLARARAEVARLETSRRRLVAWVSHDLRTPLTGMRVMAEALEDGMADDPQGYTRQIRHQVDRVNHMVEDLFELSTIDSGTLRLRPEPVVLVDIASDAVADVRPLAALRGIRITPGAITGDLVLADPQALTRVITNLLTNSVRYAPAESEVRVSAQALDTARVMLSVTDQGPGVPRTDLARMFDVGWRADPARGDGSAPAVPARTEAPVVSGAGLGLAIVRGIVEAHGGEVRAGHVPEGFRMDVVLPRAVAG